MASIYIYSDKYGKIKYSTSPPAGYEQTSGNMVDMEHYITREASELTFAQLFSILAYELSSAESAVLIKSLDKDVAKLFKEWVKRLNVGGKRYIGPDIEVGKRMPRPSRKKPAVKIKKALPMERDGVNRDDQEVIDGL